MRLQTFWCHLQTSGKLNVIKQLETSHNIHLFCLLIDSFLLLFLKSQEFLPICSASSIFIIILKMFFHWVICWSDLTFRATVAKKTQIQTRVWKRIQIPPDGSEDLWYFRDLRWFFPSVNQILEVYFGWRIVSAPNLKILREIQELTNTTDRDLGPDEDLRGTRTSDPVLKIGLVHGWRPES